MPVEFLTDDEAAAYGRFTGPLSQADLDRVFFLDDDDLELVGRHRGEHMRVGFALQLTMVRWLGTFLEDPLDVPGEVLDFLAGQLGMADPSQVKRYTEREKTRFEHQWEIRRARGYREFAAAEAEFSGWVAARSRGMGRGAKIVSGTVRDSLHMIDVIFGLDGGELPEIVVSDAASYSDVVFGLLELLGISYRPAMADLPDQKGWRIKGDAGYGPLNTFARGKIDLAKIRRNWEDILRVVASIYTGAVRAYDVVTMLQRDGHPTALGEAIAMYGRIFKSLHILAYIDTDESYRRDIKGIRNLQEGRHALGRKICHGKKRAVPPLRAGPGEPARRSRPRPELRHPLDHRLSRRRHLPAQSPGLPGSRGGHGPPVPVRQPAPGVHGTYSFVLPDLAPGAIRDLRDPDAGDEDDE